jgi:thymidylate synthase (FAD)
LRIINQSCKLLHLSNFPLELIEEAGRTCYKSEEKRTNDSSQKFVKMILKSGHESVIEHAFASVRFITNRGVTHELVRHRLCAFSQESTRYVDYQKEMEFIKPVWWKNKDSGQPSNEAETLWMESIEFCETNYKKLREKGWRPEQAREILPNSLKTEIVVTANFREWRHIFKLRTSKAAHPQIRELMTSCLEMFKKEIPILFDDI